MGFLIWNKKMLKVNLKEHSYDIEISSSSFESAILLVKELRASKRTLAFITDSNVYKFHKDKIDAIASGEKIFILEAGENSKNFENLEKICNFLAEKNTDRKGALFAIGGGVVGDISGFAAAIYMRGIDFYQIPTTLLAMVDSSVGGKTAVNLKNGKNLVGVFYQPKKVFIDIGFLKTLPSREFAAGMGEVIKYAIMCDKEFFEDLKNEKDSLANLEKIITKCCQIKANVVAADERETSKEGGRALLNLGHTFAHAIESASGYGTYLHGEAVAIGMVLAAKLSENISLAKNISQDVSLLLQRYKLPTSFDKNLSPENLFDYMKRDKKVGNGKMKLVLLKSIGNAMTYSDVSESDILNVLKHDSL